MEPTALHAGDSIAWTRDVPAYPAREGWALHYALRGAGVIDITARGGAPYRITVDAATSRDWLAGRYRWTAFVTHSDGRRYTLDTGDVIIHPDATAQDGHDVRSHAARMLDLIEAALEKRIPKDQQAYEIDGQRIDRIPIERLEALRTRYRREVSRASSRRLYGRTLYGRF